MRFNFDRRILYFIFIFAFCTGVVIFFISKNKSVPVAKVSKILIKPNRFSNIKKSLKNENRDENALSETESIDNERTKKQDEEYQQCWERVERQLGPEEFLKKNQESLQNTVGAWFYNNEKPTLDYKSVSKEDSFFLGLAKAGLIEGLNSKIGADEESLDQAMLLLTQVHLENPDNAAPAVFMALIEQRRNNLPESRRWYNLATHSKYFDTFQKSVSEKIFSLVENPDDLIQAISLNSQTPSLNYMELRKFLIFAKDSKISTLMINGNRKLLDGFESVSYLPVEYAIGFSVLKKNQVQNSFPDYRAEFILNRNSIDSIGEQTFKKLMQDCDLRTLESNVQILKEFILKNKIKLQRKF